MDIFVKNLVKMPKMMPKTVEIYYIMEIIYVKVYENQQFY